VAPRAGAQTGAGPEAPVVAPEDFFDGPLGPLLTVPTSLALGNLSVG